MQVFSVVTVVKLSNIEGTRKKLMETLGPPIYSVVVWPRSTKFVDEMVVNEACEVKWRTIGVVMPRLHGNKNVNPISQHTWLYEGGGAAAQWMQWSCWSASGRRQSWCTVVRSLWLHDRHSSRHGTDDVCWWWLGYCRVFRFHYYTAHCAVGVIALAGRHDNHAGDVNSLRPPLTVAPED